MTDKPIKGALVAVHMDMESSEHQVEVIDLTEENKGNNDETYQNTLADALELVKHIEDGELQFDKEFLEHDEYLASQGEIRDMNWGEITSHGYYRIESVWAGGLKDGGAEYRFYPVTVEIEVQE